MNIETSDLDHAELVGLLQPYVDDELTPDERERVAAQIADNPEYQAIVSEQQEVRQLLRGLELEAAPPGLRERVRGGLDGVDAEREAADERGVLAPIVGRIRSFGRGTMLMAPAAAAAIALFFGVRAGMFDNLDGQVDGVHVDGGMANSLKLRGKHERAGAQAETEAQPAIAEPEGEDSSLAELEGRSFPVQFASPGQLPEGIAVVSDGARGDSVSVEYERGGRVVVVDHQRRAGTSAPVGTRQTYRGEEFYLGRDTRGRARVEFELRGVHHSLVLADDPGASSAAVDVGDPDFARLLEIGAALRRSHGG